ncbi:glycosyltransferase family 2 protein [Spirochaetota bacterium]
MMKPKVTIAIPLYKSAPFYENIIRNIEVFPDNDVEIIISDRHSFDDTIDRLAEYFADKPNVICIKQSDELNWVQHINVLLKEAKGEYWRFLPHDDISPAGSLESLVSALDLNKNAVLTYGPTVAIDYDENPLSQFDQPSPHPHEAKYGWTFGLALKMFWNGFCDGAFKGLIRRNLIIEKGLFIRCTKDLILPERCWLFALALTGPFIYVDNALYIKRFYNGSVHSKWKIKSKHYLSAAQVMSEYLEQLFGLGAEWKYGTMDLISNANRFAHWVKNPQEERPVYKAASWKNNDNIMNRVLSIR